MPHLSEDQLKQIAQQFHDVGVSIGQFRLHNIHQGAALRDPAIVRLWSLQWNLLSTSSSFYIQAAQVTLADADLAAKKVTDATAEAKEAIKSLEDIDKIITIGSSVTALAPAIYSGDVDQVATAAEGVWNAVKN